MSARTPLGSLEREPPGERERIEQEMREGYLATREDREEISRDWEIVDGEDWTEYGKA